MILKSLIKNKPLTIHYYSNGLLKTAKGYLYNLNLNQQTISLKDEGQRVFCVPLSSIKEIH
ncbi:YolD-like family protein [Priestia megaterium]